MPWHQWLLLLPGVAAIALTFAHTERLRRWAPVLGLLSQPGWFVAAWLSHQQGVMIMTACYCVVWLFGFYKLWIAPLPNRFRDSVEAMLDQAYADEDFLEEVRLELRRARKESLGGRIMVSVLAMALGDLCHAVLDERPERVHREAIRIAVAAARLTRDRDDLQVTP